MVIIYNKLIDMKNKIEQMNGGSKYIQSLNPLIMLQICLALCLCLSPLYGQNRQTGFDASRYNVVWDSPGSDATASMPVGNGDMGANVYITDSGDLYLLLSKTDAFDWQGNVWKTGRVRISMNPNPNPFRQTMGETFRQTLNLAEGCIDVTVFTRVASRQIRVWIDANHPVCHVDVQSDTDMDIRVEPEFWKRADGSFDRLETLDSQLVWYHANGERSCYPDDLKYYGVEDMADHHPDPFRRRTFGCAMQVEGLKPDRGAFSGFGKSFAVEIASLTRQVENTAEWVDEARSLLAPCDREQAFREHCDWWKAFWNRSWITATDNTLPPDEREKPAPPAAPGQRGEKDGGYIVAQSYNVSRYIMACQGRGEYQTQFNGGIFTVPFPDYRKNDGSLFGEDERDWGNRFTFQNQRLLYWPMLAAGDFEMMRPF
ncbi:MAG: DUF5703 domain-containing protein, partial [Dysgonamonadaceae bacterium]|nr:DUF5703 domain-containing protein [Dysgonamonadaceae bacterium]